MEIKIFTIIPIFIFPIFLIRFPALKDLIREMEKKIPELQGRLFLLFYPFRTEKDDNRYYRKAEEETEKIISTKRILGFVNFKPLIPVIFLLPIFFIYKNNGKIELIKPYIEILYKKDFVKKNDKFLILSETNLRDLFLVDGKKKEKFYRTKKGFGVIYSVEKSCSLKIKSGRFKRDIFINALDDFKIVSVITRVKYPSRIKTEYIDSVIAGKINFIEGSKLTIDGEMNREIKEIFSNTFSEIEKKYFHIEYSGKKDTVLKFYFKDEYNIKSDIFNVHVKIIRDSPPVVRITYPLSDVRITDISTFPLSFEIEDDIGISSYSIQIEDNEIINKNIFSNYIKDSTTIILRNILPNDTLILYVKAKDVSGKIGISNPLLIYMPPLEELFKDISKTTDFVDEKTEELQKKQKDIKEKIERILEKGMIKEKDKRELKNVLEEQKTLIENLENLVEFVKNLNSPEIMKEMEMIKELLNDMKMDLGNIKKETSPKDISELMEMKIEQEKLLNMLEITRKSLEMIKKLVDLNRAIAELGNIKETEQGILDSFPDNRTSKKQEELNERTESFLNSLKDSESDDLKEIANMMESMNTINDMKTLKELMKNNKMDNMLSNKIMADLNTLLDMLKKKREDLTGGEETRKRIILLATDIYFLIDKMEDFQRIDDIIIKMKSFAGIKEAIDMDINISQSLFIKTLSFSPKVFENLSDAKKLINDYIESLSKNILSDVLLSNVVSKMGEAIILLFSSPQQSAGSMLQQLMQLQQKQLSINSQMSMILPLPSPQRGEALNELAQKQREIARKLGELGEAFSPLKEEMEKIAEMMERGYIDEEVLKRQEKVIEQFLEAEKSIRRKEISRKRKSEPGKYYKPLIVEIPEEMGERNLLLKKLLMKRLMEEKIPDKYRKDVEEYFWEITK